MGGLHVLSDGGVADSVGSSRDGGLAAVAAAAAVQAGHVDAVQVVMVLSSSVAQRLHLAVLLAPANATQHCKPTTRGPPLSKGAPRCHVVTRSFCSF